MSSEMPMSSDAPKPGILFNEDAFKQAEDLAFRDGIFAGFSCALSAGAFSASALFGCMPTRPRLQES
jgi:hypothetical protein